MVYLICPVTSCLTTTFNTATPTQAHVTNHLLTVHNVTTPPDLIPLLRQRQQKVWQTRWDALNRQLDDKAQLRLRQWTAFGTNPARGVPEEVDCDEEQMALFRLAEAWDDGEDEDGGVEGEEEEEDGGLVGAWDAAGGGGRPREMFGNEGDSEVVEAARILLGMIGDVDDTSGGEGEEEEGEEEEEEGEGDKCPADEHRSADQVQETNEDVALLQHFQRFASQRPGNPTRATRSKHPGAGSVSGASSPRQQRAQRAFAQTAKASSMPTLETPPTEEKRRSSSSSSGMVGRRCPVPDCDVVRNRLVYINQHLREKHGVRLETGTGGNMDALRARQDAQWRVWCLRRKYRGDIPRDQPVE